MSVSLRALIDELIGDSQKEYGLRCDEKYKVGQARESM